VDRAKIIELQKPLLKGQPADVLRSVGIPIDQWTLREENEAYFEKLLREYITNPTVNGLPKYRYGGMVNLCYTLAKVCAGLEAEAAVKRLKSEVAYSVATSEFAELEKTLDLDYSDEARGRDWDAGADDE
jgi:hypothetical protein